MQSLTNRIIANIKKNADFSGTNFIDSNNVVCIDTSNNRIGINTKIPSCSIDISGNSANDKIKVHNLDVSYAIIFDISCDNIQCPSMNILEADFSSIDVSLLLYHELSGNKIESSFIFSNEISSNKLDVSFMVLKALSANIIDVSNISTNKITTSNFNIDTFISNNLTVNISGDISYIVSNYIESTTISADNIKCIDLSATNMDICNANISDLSVNNLSVAANADFSGISCNSFDANKIDCSNINIFGDISLSGGITGDGIKFDNLDISDLSVNELIINEKIYGPKNWKIDITNGILYIPIDSDPPNLYKINLLSDNDNNYLKLIKDGGKIKYFFNNDSTMIIFNNDISGNNISYENDIWFIKDENNLIKSITDISYKLIPIKIDENNNFNANIDILYNKYIKINDKRLFYNSEDHLTNSDPPIKFVYEINCNLGLKLINENPGDIEVSDYELCLFTNKLPYDNVENDIIENSYRKYSISNTIIVFDMSFNYSNTSLNSIINFNIDSTDQNYIFFGIRSSNSDNLKKLSVDKFYCTLKLIDMI